jgi:hypothetical protein
MPLVAVMGVGAGVLRRPAGLYLCRSQSGLSESVSRINIVRDSDTAFRICEGNTSVNPK